MPQGQSDAVCCIAQSTVRLKSNAGLHTEAGFAVSAHYVLEVVVEVLDDKDDLL